MSLFFGIGPVPNRGWPLCSSFFLLARSEAFGRGGLLPFAVLKVSGNKPNSFLRVKENTYNFGPIYFPISVQKAKLAEVDISLVIIVKSLKNKPAVLKFESDTNSFEADNKLFEVQTSSKVFVKAPESLSKAPKFLLYSCMNVLEEFVNSLILIRKFFVAIK